MLAVQRELISPKICRGEARGAMRRAGLVASFTAHTLQRPLTDADDSEAKRPRQDGQRGQGAAEVERAAVKRHRGAMEMMAGAAVEKVEGEEKILLRQVDLIKIVLKKPLKL